MIEDQTLLRFACPCVYRDKDPPPTCWVRWTLVTATSNRSSYGTVNYDHEKDLVKISALIVHGSCAGKHQYNNNISTDWSNTVPKPVKRGRRQQKQMSNSDSHPSRYLRQIVCFWQTLSLIIELNTHTYINIYIYIIFFKKILKDSNNPNKEISQRSKRRIGQSKNEIPGLCSEKIVQYQNMNE
jgi:hypothetical protein